MDRSSWEYLNLIGIIDADRDLIVRAVEHSVKQIILGLVVVSVVQIVLISILLIKIHKMQKQIQEKDGER